MNYIYVHIDQPTISWEREKKKQFQQYSASPVFVTSQIHPVGWIEPSGVGTSLGAARLTPAG